MEIEKQLEDGPSLNRDDADELVVYLFEGIKHHGLWLGSVLTAFGSR
jgi:hypothetical protein